MKKTPKRTSKGDWVPATGFGQITQVILVLPLTDAQMVWTKLAEGDVLFAAYQQNETIEPPGDFDLNLHAKIKGERAEPLLALLLTDRSTAVARGQKAITAAREKSAMGKSETRRCGKCGQQWWVEDVFIKSDRSKPSVPTSEMCVPCAGAYKPDTCHPALQFATDAG